MRPPRPAFGPSGAGKGAGITEAPGGVNAVLPGPILTRVWDSTSQEDRQQAIEQTTAKRFGTPAEVAAAIAFLASPDASYITGTALAVDGGWSVFKTSV